MASDRLPPRPLPEHLWGEEWQFATLQAGDLLEEFAELPIPIKSIPEFFQPLDLGLASNTPISGIIIYGGRQSMRLARWLQEQEPVALKYVSGELAGLVLEAGLANRWIVATFTDAEVMAAAQTYAQRQQLSQGWHFLLIQPDDSGVTYSGFWLLHQKN